MVVILGAGLAGLSAAHHLRGRDAVVVEREAEVGGLCRSFRARGFTFDCTGHLLHLRDPEVRAWAERLLPGGWARLDRSAWIFSHGTLTPYPFQANTAGLPIDVRLACLEGFVETLRKGAARGVPVPDAVPVDPGLPFLKVAPPRAAGEPLFRDWIHATFGAGFARHFFEPYNGKLWQVDLGQITGDWVSWSIPRPELADVLRGAITRNEKAFGYNPNFMYPSAGGIDALPRALSAGLPDGLVRTGCAATALNAAARRVTLANGETLSGSHVLSSLPLPALAALTEDLPAALRTAAGELRHVSVRAVNLGLRGPPVHPDVQWVYFPEAFAPFHRIGLPCALTPAMAPPGHHSIVAEISFLPGRAPSREESVEQTLAALAAAGFLRTREDVVFTEVRDIPEAYVVFDEARRRVLPGLLRWYVERRVVPFGRYGAWDYTSMEESLVHGRQAAAWIAAGSG